MKNKPLLGVALAALVLGAVVLLRSGADDTHKAAAGGAPKAPAVDRSSSEVVLSIVPGVKREARAATTSKVSPLFLELRAGGKFKPIYERLKALPNASAEEAYVLAAILEACAKVVDRKGKHQEPFKVDEAKQRFAASLSTKAPNRERRIEAFEKAMSGGGERCADFEIVEMTEKGLRDLYARSAAAGDPKAQARLLSLEVEDSRRDAKGEIDWMKPVSISDDQIERLKRVIASGDPRALVDASSLLMFGNADVHLRGPDEAPIDAQILYYASTLAACELGYPCGPDSVQVAGACAFSGRCDAADYRDYILFYELAPGNAQLAMQYQAELLRVIRDGDWSFFTFQRGPAPATAALRRP